MRQRNRVAVEPPRTGLDYSCGADPLECFEQLLHLRDPAQSAVPDRR